MSSIIDALKKSDQNRNNDSRADINNIKFSDKPAEKSRKGFWLLVIVLLFIATGIYAWQQGWHHSLLNYFSAPDSNSKKLDVSNEQQKQLPVVAKNQQTSKQDQAAKQNINQLTPPNQTEIKTISERTKRINTAQNPPVSKLESKEQAALEEEKPKKEQLEEPTNLAQNNLKPAPKETDKKSDKKAKPLKETVAADQNVQKSLEPSMKQDYLLIHQIDFAIRKNIPNIKINIHIYDPDPENRMVLINGERYNIGDSIEEVLTVADIVQEGIVVSYENLQFLIPK